MRVLGVELSLSVLASEISCWLLVKIYLREGGRRRRLFLWVQRLKVGSLELDYRYCEPNILNVECFDIPVKLY